MSKKNGFLLIVLLVLLAFMVTLLFQDEHTGEGKDAWYSESDERGIGGREQHIPEMDNIVRRGKRG